MDKISMWHQYTLLTKKPETYICFGRSSQKMSFLIRTLPSVPEFQIRSPDQPLSRVMDYTIGRDFHPATKTTIFFYQDDSSILCKSYYNSFITHCLSLINRFFIITILRQDISNSILSAVLS